MEHFDLIIVGSGAGLMVMEAALNKGLRCAIIEKAKFGGTCLTKGCIPSKMLVYPADFIREAQSAERFGVRTGPVQLDWDTVSKRMWEQIDFNKTIEKNLFRLPNLTVYKGSAAFIDAGRMAVSRIGEPDEIISGDKFVLAAGARSFVPDIAGLEEAGYITSERFFGDKFPKTPWKSLAIVGSGAIGCEFAHIFSAFGTQVTLISRTSVLLNKEEEDVAQFVEKQFARAGITVLNDSDILSAAAGDGQKQLTVQNRLTGQRTVVACDEILIAAGVRSNADSLALEKAGVETDQHGWISTNAYLETSQPHIWALGDINGKYQFRHKANYEAQVLIQNFFSDGEKTKARYDSVPWTIFTHPQVSHVGITEKEARQQGLAFKTAKNHYSEVVGGRAMGYHDRDADNGFVKMIIGDNKKILGVHIVGPYSSVLLQPFVYLMNAGYQCAKKCRSVGPKEFDALRILCPDVGSYAPINDSMVIHPSLNELTAWVFEKLGAE